MKTQFTPWSTTSLLMVGALLATFSHAVTAAALVTLKGETLASKLASEAAVRVSVLGWTASDQAAAVVAEYKKYLAEQNHEQFAKFLQAQETQGYLFTKEATGYTVKYAWQSDDALNKRMVLLVTPALTTRNPYQWKQSNKSGTPFTLLELQWSGEEALMSTSIDTPIEINLQDALELKEAGASIFARLRDDTPYYLKNQP
jgi:hypothetical protein